ncbi:MAG: (Fe-S)-binding protein [Mogibacterium sp.]|nr:(Fe-S)-binding protein [Mogibacterium sp.]
MISIEKCIHCHKCRNNCDFLSKYGIDLCDTDRLRELAFHCFLCGKCTAVCPVGIDGRKLIIELRRQRADSDERKEIERKFKRLISEKRDYRFRNWKYVTSGAVFFPGCNFPSMYPKTNNVLVNLFKEHGIGTVYECCGKPIAELGLTDDENRIITGIKKQLDAAGVKEVITACPNCWSNFGDRLGVKVRSVYDKLREIGYGYEIDEDLEFYLPCPDRAERKWIEEISPFIKGTITINDAAQCCGLGGSAIAFEREIADGFVKKLGESTEKRICSYCASCNGRFRRCGIESVEHILTLILGTAEHSDIYKSYINRVLTKYR